MVSFLSLVNTRLSVVINNSNKGNAMAWQWSHTTDACQSIEQQLIDKAESASNGEADDAEWLQVCWAEWVASDWRERNGSTHLDLRKYELALLRAKRQAADHSYGKLAEDIWNWSEQLRTCTNGGWDAWVCPFGCHWLAFNETEVD